jgi:hypothetical protein
MVASRFRPDPGKGRERAIIVQRKPHDVLLRFGSGAYSAKLLNGTRQRLDGFSHVRQCGDEVLRMLVTGGRVYRWCASALWVSQSEISVGIFVGIYVPNRPQRNLLVPLRSSQLVYFFAGEPGKPF